MKRKNIYVFFIILSLVFFSGCGKPAREANDEDTKLYSVEMKTESVEIENKHDKPENSLFPEEKTCENVYLLEKICNLIKVKNYPMALFCMQQISEDEEVERIEKQIREVLFAESIALLEDGTGLLAVDQNGNVQVVSEDRDDIPKDWITTVKQWNHIEAVFSTVYGVVGIDDRDGSTKFVAYENAAPGYANRLKMYDALSSMSNVKGISVVHWWSIYYLMKDGSISKYDLDEGMIPNYFNIENAVKICGNVALLRNGKLRILDGYYDVDNDIETWSNIVDFDLTEGNKIVALKADGTVQMAGLDRENYEVSDWENLISIRIANSHLIGLKQDGTVLVQELGFRKGVPSNRVYLIDDIQKIVVDWKDVVAIKACQSGFVGVKSNGEILTAEYETSEKSDFVPITKGIHLDVSQFHNLYISEIE